MSGRVVLFMLFPSVSACIQHSAPDCTLCTRFALRGASPCKCDPPLSRRHFLKALVTRQADRQRRVQRWCVRRLRHRCAALRRLSDPRV